MIRTAFVRGTRSSSLDRARRKQQAESETDREPDPPHAHLVEMAGGSLADGPIAGAGRSDEAITLVRQPMRESFRYPAHTILALEDLPSLCLLPFMYQVRNDIVDERFVFGSDPCTREIDDSYFSFNSLRLVFSQ